MRYFIQQCQILTALLAISGPALSAQASISFDARGSYGIPFGDFSDGTEGDFGFGAGAVLSLSPGFGIYGGWGQDSFQCTSVLCSPDSRLNVLGFEGGVKASFPTPGGVEPWIRAGLTSKKVEFDGESLDFESDRQLGFQGAFGVDFPLGEVLSVSPAIRVNLMSVDDDDFFDDPGVRYLTFDLGAHIHLPRR
jgi:hypothetical protein